jgi:hypothetical protein
MMVRGRVGRQPGPNRTRRPSQGLAVCRAGVLQWAWKNNLQFAILMESYLIKAAFYSDKKLLSEEF